MNKNTKKRFVTGTLLFEWKKIILHTTNENFFVRPPLANKFLHGDTVSAIIFKSSDASLLAEVKIHALVSRSKKTLLWHKKWAYIFPLASISTLEKIKIHPKKIKEYTHIPEGTLVTFCVSASFAEIREIFEKNHHDEGVASILFLNDIHENFDAEIKKQETFLKKNTSFWKSHNASFPEHSLLFWQNELQNHWKNHEWIPYFENISDQNETRIDMRNWFTLTIDGADARDLDDAISIAKFDNWNFLLGVHIADVSHFVWEKTPIDREARERGTSIYLPEKVIPMLPETLSNHLCSLNTESEKKTLTCLLRIDEKTGKVLKSDIFKSLIKSQHRGMYDEIYTNFSQKNFQNPHLQTTIETAFELFEILKKRRKKEGKMTFETTELYFKTDKNHQVTDIFKRERNDAHMLIEEYMVLANEEVAKWCHKRQIPYLSRFHDAPSEENSRIIEEIIGNSVHKNRKKSQKWQSNTEVLSPKNIADYLESLDEYSRYHATKLILPKMSKAFYSAHKTGHFGLALDFYAHFTSPIRRYPDLITHRMIHRYLDKQWDDASKKRYKRHLEKTAEIASQREKRAENIEHAVDKIYILRFMNQHIGKTFDGIIAGIAEWGIFVELENGVEITVYLPKSHHFQLDFVAGAIIDKNQKILYKIGDKKRVTITKILEKESRIIGEFV